MKTNLGLTGSKFPFIKNFQICNQTLTVIHLIVKPDLIYLKGHFVDCPIVPGIVLVNWAIKFIDDTYEGLSANQIHNIEWLKFMKPIDAETECNLELYRFETNKVKYNYLNQECQFSSGVIVFGI